MEMNAAIAALAALAQETRLQIFRYLVTCGTDGAAAGEIGGVFGLPGATLSFHLSILKQAGLVQVQREGRSLIYATDFRQMSTLLAFLMEDCCGGKCNIPDC
jgi:ArsR family transcriptional regulator